MYTDTNGDFIIEVINMRLVGRGEGIVGIVLHPGSFDIKPNGRNGFLIEFARNPAGHRMREQYGADGLIIDIDGGVFAWSNPYRLGGLDGTITSVEGGGSEVR